MSPAKIPMNELKEAFHRDVFRFGRVPSREKQNKDGTYTGTTYSNRFGSWNKALRELGYKVKKHHGHIEVDCFNCGKTMEKELNQIENTDNNFCSKSCLNQAKEFNNCSHCGREFEADYRNGNGNVYCSDECSRKSKLAIYQCENCNEEFEANKYNNRLYCTRECSHEANSRTREECIQAFRNGVEEIGDDSSLYQVMEAGGMGGGNYYRHFDSLNDIAREAGFPEMCGHGFVDCETCDSEVRKSRWYLENYEHHFCDQECYLKWMRSGALRSTERESGIYGPNWYIQRRAARARDNYTCRSCGLTEHEHKHKFGRRLEVHHIKKARLFDDYKERNKLSNLLTLCKKCHVKWEHMGVRPQIM
jgi:hypothetical protein